MLHKYDYESAIFYTKYKGHATEIVKEYVEKTSGEIGKIAFLTVK